MKIRIAVTLVVLGLLHTYIHWLPKTSKMKEAITPEPFKIEQRRTPGFVDNCLENVIDYVKQVFSDVINP